MKPPQDAEVHESLSTYMWFDKEGNLCIKHKEDYPPSHSIEVVRQNLAVLDEILQGKKANFIFDIDNAKPNKKEAREYAADQFPKYVNAFAFVSTKPMSRMLVNLFYAFKKPPYPTKIFDTEEKARAWLKKYPIT